MEVLVVGNTAYVDDDFCAKAFPGDHVKVVAAAEARRDESSIISMQPESEYPLCQTASQPAAGFHE